MQMGISEEITVLKRDNTCRGQMDSCTSVNSTAISGNRTKHKQTRKIDNINLVENLIIVLAD